MPNESEAAPEKREDSSVYEMACGMLAQDWKILVPLYLILISPQVAAILTGADTARGALMLMLAGRIIDLVFLFIIGTRWLRRLSIRERPLQFKPLLPIVSVGCALWLLFMVPLAAQFSALPEIFKIALLLLLIPAVVLNLRLFFFFMPLLLGQRPTRAAFGFAQTFTKSDPYVALKVVLAPAALALLIPNLISSFSPDERSAVVNTLVDLSAGIFWLFTAYIALAHGLRYLPESAWHESGLDPYRQARLATLAMRGAPWFAKLLSPKKTLVLLLLSALIWAGNFLRLAEMPPAPTLTVRSIAAQDRGLTLTLDAVDQVYQFRGFRPIFFALAGPQRGIISQWPERVSASGLEGDMRLGLPAETHASLRLEFLTERPAEDLVKLEDLYLWYRNVKLHKLDLSTAKLIETPKAR